VKRFFAAIGFLTVIPLPSSMRTDGDSVGTGTFYFPVVGLLIGVFLVMVYTITSKFLPLLLVASITALLTTWASGGLHMDGLTDTADGILSGTSVERTLEIMKDPNTGAFGVLAMISIITMKIFAVVSLPQTDAMWALLAAPVAGRCAMVLPMSLRDYLSGKEGGLGSVFYNKRQTGNALWASGFVVATFVITAKFHVIGLSILFFGATFLYSKYICNKLGAMTGDTYGALCEIMETMILIIFAGMLNV
jgi:adenosylcobinamide-GDP ribazoletransferase